MDAMELRIGNKFLQQNGEVGTVTYHEIRYATIEPNNGYQPIPITEEWLLKFGFDTITEWGDDNFNFWNKERDCSVDIEPQITTTKIENLAYYRIVELQRRKPIQYVHQLQNLYFALTGEELTLKIK